MAHTRTGENCIQIYGIAISHWQASLRVGTSESPILQDKIAGFPPTLWGSALKRCVTWLHDDQTSTRLTSDSAKSGLIRGKNGQYGSYIQSWKERYIMHVMVPLGPLCLWVYIAPRNWLAFKCRCIKLKVSRSVGGWRGKRADITQPNWI